MKLIVGLGNPGEKYKNTRHNTGWLVVEALANQISSFKLQVSSKYQLEYGKGLLGNNEVVLAKPLAFMNNSGEAVKRLLRLNNLTIEQCNNDFYMVHDDLDITLGKFKIQFGKGPREHKGVESVEKALKTKNFWRVRVGIENREKEIPGEEYVLGEFTKEEEKMLEETTKNVIEEIRRRLLKS